MYSFYFTYEPFIALKVVVVESRRLESVVVITSSEELSNATIYPNSSTNWIMGGGLAFYPEARAATMELICELGID